MGIINEYKHTEVGMIPKDWNVLPVGSIFNFYTTSNYSKAEMFLDGEVGCIHYGLIHAIPNTRYNLQNGIKYFVTSDQAKYEIIKDGDIIMVDASEDLIGINKSVEISGTGLKKYIAGLHTFLLRDNSYMLVNGFRGAILNSKSTKLQLVKLAVGMKVFGVSKTQLKTILIPVPPKNQQIAIASALSDADQLIISLEKLIEKKKNIKQGAMQQLLKPKKGWNFISLDKVIWYQEGPGVRNYQFTKNGVKLLNGTNIEKGQLFLDKTDRYISENEAFGFYSHFLADEGDIIIACSGVTINKFDEKVTFVQREHLPLCMNTSTMRFKVINEKIDKYFFFHFLKSDSFKEQIGGKATGSAQLNFGPSHVKNIQISLPNLIEQKEIAIILSDIDDEIDSLERKLSKSKLIKQGMMQNLLTGKIRLV